MPSSVIRSYHYDPARRALSVVFQSQRRYTYSDVPAETYAAMKAAFSKGEFFNRHTRSTFATSSPFRATTMPSRWSAIGKRHSHRDTTRTGSQTGPLHPDR